MGQGVKRNGILRLGLSLKYPCKCAVIIWQEIKINCEQWSWFHIVSFEWHCFWFGLPPKKNWEKNQVASEDRSTMMVMKRRRNYRKALKSTWCLCQDVLPRRQIWTAALCTGLHFPGSSQATETDLRDCVNGWRWYWKPCVVAGAARELTVSLQCRTPSVPSVRLGQHCQGPAAIPHCWMGCLAIGILVLDLYQCGSVGQAQATRPPQLCKGAWEDEDHNFSEMFSLRQSQNREFLTWRGSNAGL